MNDLFATAREAGRRSVEFQIRHQQEDGGYIWDGFPRDAYHKQPYSWGLAGHEGAAHRLLTWVREATLQDEGGLRDYNGDVYKHAWLFLGAHRLGRFDVSYPVMTFLRSCQAPCGGFPHFAGQTEVRSLPTGWMGIAALLFGKLDLARTIADCCISMLEQQPERTRFYYQTTLQGDLVTPDVRPDAPFVDCTQPEQCYWEIGLPWMLMGKLYQATGDAHYLRYASRFFDLKRECADDAFSFTGSGKSSLAAAVHYQNTGDVRARDAVLAFLNRLLATQQPNGCWCSKQRPAPLLIYLDHGAEFNVWIHETTAILAAERETGLASD